MRKVALLFLFLTACGTASAPTPKGVARGAQLELDLAKCREGASTCPGYILCSDRVHREYGLEPKKLVCVNGGEP